MAAQANNRVKRQIGIVLSSRGFFPKSAQHVENMSFFSKAKAAASSATKSVVATGSKALNLKEDAEGFNEKVCVFFVVVGSRLAVFRVDFSGTAK